MICFDFLCESLRSLRLCDEGIGISCFKKEAFRQPTPRFQ
jgi:hypothetical protein